MEIFNDGHLHRNIWLATARAQHTLTLTARRTLHLSTACARTHRKLSVMRSDQWKAGVHHSKHVTVHRVSKKLRKIVFVTSSSNVYQI